MPRKKTGSAIVEGASVAGDVPVDAGGPSATFDFGQNAGDAGTGDADFGGGGAVDQGEGSAFALVGEDHGGRGPGRPAGAKNVRDTKLIELIERQHGSPLAALGRIYSFASDPVAMYVDLKQRAAKEGLDAKSVGMTIKDCIDLIIRAAMAALPYHAKKLPQAVELQTDAQAVIFNISIGNRQIGMTEQRAARILEGEEIEDAEIVDAIAEYEAEHEV